MVGEQDAADVTQQVFLQVFRKLEQFGGRASFETWLYRLATNECLQHLRRSRRRTAPRLREDAPDVSPGHVASVDTREALETALGRLEPELRSIFLLREVERLPYEQIARALDIPEGTVGSRLNRARRELRDHLRELLPS
jgi:RNA polymerase sigma-70 factor (ECF subfamily)